MARYNSDKWASLLLHDVMRMTGDDLEARRLGVAEAIIVTACQEAFVRGYERGKSDERDAIEIDKYLDPDNQELP